MSIDNELKCMGYGVAGLFLGIIAGVVFSVVDAPAAKPYSKPKERFVDEYIDVPVGDRYYNYMLGEFCTYASRRAHYTTFRLNGSLRHKLECRFRGYNHEVISDTKDEAISAMSTLLSA